jgi:glycopeptide antibiotics resistance protein
VRLREYPGFLPGLAVSIVVAFALATRLGRTLHVSRLIAWGLVFGVGVIVSATLTPGGGVFRSGAEGSGACDLSRLSLASIREVLRFGETGLNVLLFVPLGLAIGLMPRSRAKLGLIMAAAAFPFLIEAMQLIVTVLDRQCQSADVVDNLTGLAIGLVIGTILGLIIERVGDSPGSDEGQPTAT